MPIMIGLAIVLWAATLGLTAILVGTLCDERARTVNELHEAYVGVVEVLAKYLQSAHSGVKARSHRVAELSQAVAEELELSPRQVDDVRVAALLQDLGHVEVTTQIINRAVAALDLKSSPSEESRHTFQGAELVQSLGTVLHGAMPLLLNDEDRTADRVPESGERRVDLAPVGARIIQAVRAYDELTRGPDGVTGLSPQEAVAAVRAESPDSHDPQVLSALERALRQAHLRAPAEPVLS
jgi:response regulator RpfG family c-di-GMP phosphodiesterase